MVDCNDIQDHFHKNKHGKRYQFEKTNERGERYELNTMLGERDSWKLQLVKQTCKAMIEVTWSKQFSKKDIEVHKWGEPYQETLSQTRSKR